MTRRIQCQALDGSRLGCGGSARLPIAFRTIRPHQDPARTRRAAVRMLGEKLVQRGEGRRGFSVPRARNSQGNLLSNDFK